MHGRKAKFIKRVLKKYEETARNMEYNIKTDLKEIG
jgi:hypothetical protein